MTPRSARSPPPRARRDVRRLRLACGCRPRRSSTRPRPLATARPAPRRRGNVTECDQSGNWPASRGAPGGLRGSRKEITLASAEGDAPARRPDRAGTRARPTLGPGLATSSLRADQLRDWRRKAALEVSGLRIGRWGAAARAVRRLAITHAGARQRRCRVRRSAPARAWARLPRGSPTWPVRSRTSALSARMRDILWSGTLAAGAAFTSGSPILVSPPPADDSRTPYMGSGPKGGRPWGDHRTVMEGCRTWPRGPVCPQACSRSVGCPVMPAMSSKSLSRCSTVSPASSAVAAMSTSGMDGARC